MLKRNASVKPVSYVGRLTEALTNSETSQKISNDYRFKNRLPKTEKFQGDMMKEQEEQLVQMVKETDVPLPNPHNLPTNSSAVKCQ